MNITKEAIRAPSNTPQTPLLTFTPKQLNPRIAEARMAGEGVVVKIVVDWRVLDEGMVDVMVVEGMVDVMVVDEGVAEWCGALVSAAFRPTTNIASMLYSALDQRLLVLDVCLGPS